MKSSRDETNGKKKCDEFRTKAEKTLYDVSSCRWQNFSVYLRKGKKSSGKRAAVFKRLKNWKKDGDWWN